MLEFEQHVVKSVKLLYFLSQEELEETSNGSSNSKKLETSEKEKAKEFRDRDMNKERKKKDKLRMYTADPALLLSFVYFDQSHCGYIFDKDVEEILFTLGLNLSRAQVISQFLINFKYKFT